ncbi:hypothetical protein BSKO_03604 [Bryopsis sp. KO-2023]|nr:hypothetical protein BSKO_03604 [Bryopsis sp. KO-2023]
MTGSNEPRSARLEHILERETAKNLRYQTKQPAQFRDTILSTHKFLTPRTDIAQGVSSCASIALQRKKLGNKRERSRKQNPNIVPVCGEPCSVFKATGEQTYAAKKAAEQRRLRATSDWALLDTFEVAMYNDEYKHRMKAKTDAKARQKEFLDRQMQALEKVRTQEEADKKRDHAIMEKQVAKHEEEKERTLKLERDRNANLKKERETLAKEAAEARERAQHRKMAAEKRELERIEQDLEAEKVRQQRRKEAATKEMMKTKEENDKNIAAKKESARLEAERNEQMMKEMLKLLEKQERDREEALKAFQENVAARSRKAGESVVAEKEAREEKERALLKCLQERKQKELEEKERNERIEKEKLLREVQASRKKQIEAKVWEKERLRKEMEKYVEQVKRKDADALSLEKREQEERRKRNYKHKEELEKQMREAELKVLEGDIPMCHRERNLNLALLTQAGKIVGGPQILPLQPFK